VLGADNGGATHRTGVFTVGNKEWAQLADAGNAGLGSLGVYAHGQDYGVYADTEAMGTGVNGVGGAGGGAGVVGTGGGTGPGVIATGGPEGAPGVFGTGTGTGTGVAGQGGSNSGTGMQGTGAGDGYGVSGTGSGTGVGVFGQGGGNAGTGVVGRGGGHGVGVFGDTASARGTGIWAENSFGGTALHVEGPAVFTRSGTVTVRAGKSSATKTHVALTAASLVLATVQHDEPGIWVRCAVPDAARHSFTVHLSKAVKASTKVAWFVIN
jgi:hypothetical protein